MSESKKTSNLGKKSSSNTKNTSVTKETSTKVSASVAKSSVTHVTKEVLSKVSTDSSKSSNSKATSVAKKSSGKVVAKFSTKSSGNLIGASENLSYGTGRRKESTARVWIRKGTGNVVVRSSSGEKLVANYFPRLSHQIRVVEPLNAVGAFGNFDILSTITGGGITGQADALRLGIANALANMNSEFRLILRGNGMLTRDDREVQSKNYGLAKARKQFTYRKR